MRQEQDFCRLHVWEGIRNLRDPVGVVEGRQAIGQVLEDSGKDWRRDCADAGLDAVNRQALHPLYEQLHFALLIAYCNEALEVEAMRIDDLRMDCRLLAMELHQAHSMQQAQEPNQHVLEVQNLDALRLLVCVRMSAEGHQIGSSDKELSLHRLHILAAVPKSRVSLLCPEDDKEADEHGEGAVSRIVVQDIGEEQICTVPFVHLHDLEGCAHCSAPKGQVQRLREDAPSDSQQVR
mmetsp:Transcript_24676/g.65633  ORF Transcript_24676/g.65633 Transcript_24676/m.65633 type:complete len:236 (+) Transcript_24676:556-1263(+)